PGRTVLEPGPVYPVLKPQTVQVGSVRYRFSASRLLSALRNFLRPNSLSRFSPRKGSFGTSRDWAGVKGSTSSYQPLTRILSSSFLIVESAQARRQAAFGTIGA